MTLRILLPLFGLLFTLSGLQAQDIHYTLYNMSPLATNPALTGAYNGSIRVGGIYRSQWYTVENYSTPNLYVDAPVLRGFRDKDWIGVGAMLLQDNVGPLSQTQFGFSAAYHLGLGKKGGTVLTLGGQYGSINRTFNPSGLQSEGTIGTNLGGGGLPEDDDIMGTGGMGTGGMNNDGDLKKAFNDISAGLLLRTKLNQDAGLELGFAMQHIGTPEYNLISRDSVSATTGAGIEDKNRAAKLAVHGQLDYQLNEKWSFEPTFLYQTTAKQSEINLQAWMGRRINPDVKLNFGLGYRFGDAAKLLFGLDYKDLRAALSYDFTLSSAGTITNNNGGPEIAAYYIFKIYKQPQVIPKLLCPQF